MQTKLLTIGPVQMDESTVEIRSKQIPYFRNENFSELMLENERLLKKLQFADEDSRVVFLTSSGTGAMEAAVMNLFDERDRLLVISGGTFGQRFENICRIHKIPFDVLRVSFDEDLKPEHFENFNPKNYTGLLVNIHETSIGKLYDINVINEFRSRGDMLLVVDAISSFLCDNFRMKDNDIDASIISSQKGLCLAPGMSFVTLNYRAQNKVELLDSKSVYFNFKDYLSNIERGQTPFTPAVGVCCELNDRLISIDNRGLSKVLLDIEYNAKCFRRFLKNSQASFPMFSKSNAITTVLLSSENAKEIIDYLKNEHGIIVNPSNGELGKYSFRVSHVGNIDLKDYKIVVDTINKFSI